MGLPGRVTGRERHPTPLERNRDFEAQRLTVRSSGRRDIRRCEFESCRASEHTEFLFVLLWTNLSYAEAPVSGGCRFSAVADIATDKPITPPALVSCTMIGRDDARGTAANRSTSAVYGIAAMTIVEVRDKRIHADVLLHVSKCGALPNPSVSAPSASRQFSHHLYTVVDDIHFAS